MATIGKPEEELTEFISTTSYGDLPDETPAFVEDRFIDTIGVMVAGAIRDPGMIVKKLASSQSGPKNSNRLEITDNGFTLGVIGHTLDFDDSTHTAHAHLSVTVIPTILALSQQREVTGKEAITAYTAGYETAYYLAGLVMDGHYEKGWHGTATLGVYASTATASTLLNLGTEATRHALNIASSMPSGSRANFGTWMKPVHAGHAVRSGITAALLASEGCNAADDVISGRYGFLELYSGRDDWQSQDLLTLGEEWGHIKEGVNTKKYPCCHATHAAIETTIDLMDTHDITVDNIDTIEVITSEFPSHNLHYDDPSSGLEGKFSMPYAVARAAVNKSVEIYMFDDESINDSEVQEIRKRVEHNIDESYPYNNKTTVRVIPTTGAPVEKTLDAPPGIQTKEELIDKFEMCTRSLSDEQSAELLELSDNLHNQEDVSVLLQYIDY